MEKKEAILAILFEKADQEFSDLADYIWKTPRFIKAERELEIEKLESYFPITGNHQEDLTAIQLRKRRWSLEKKKLENLFPRFMSTSNLFMALSTYEFYCLQLCKQVEINMNISLKSCRGTGINKLHNYLNNSEYKFKNSKFSLQVLAAINIRNCLIHANGILAWARNESDLRRIIDQVEFLSSLNIDGSTNGTDPRIVSIVPGAFGDEITVYNDYAFILTGYLRENFRDLCLG